MTLSISIETHHSKHHATKSDAHLNKQRNQMLNSWVFSGHNCVKSNGKLFWQMTECTPTATPNHNKNQIVSNSANTWLLCHIRTMMHHEWKREFSRPELCCCLLFFSHGLQVWETHAIHPQTHQEGSTNASCKRRNNAGRQSNTVWFCEVVGAVPHTALEVALNGR